MSQRVYLAGHHGLLGGALTRVLGDDPSVEFVHTEAEAPDLRDPAATRASITQARPDVLVLAAARVGGLGANLADPVGFFADNMRIELNVLEAALAAGVGRVLFVGSANAYPHDAAQPIQEAALGMGPLDQNTESYGLAKLAGIRLCDAYRRQHGVTYHSVVPCNLYGPGDRFDSRTAHLVAASLQRFKSALEDGAPSVTVWGSGEQRRQLLYVDDLARACAVLLALDDPPTHVNAGPSGDTSVRELSEIAAQTVGFDGLIEYDRSEPEGVLKRELDTTLARSLGWTPEVTLQDGLQSTWDWYQSSTIAHHSEETLA